MMLRFKLVILKLFLILNLVFINNSFADNHNIYETLEMIKNDLKTLERAVYSGSIELKTNNSNNSVLDLEQNSEDVLTRHLLKLSEIEDQFRELTNKFEEVNFKLDKLSTRVTKIQSDTQLRFSDLENVPNNPALKKQTSLPGSSKPQDFGAAPGYQTSNLPKEQSINCLLYTSPSPRDRTRSRMPSSA